MSEQARFQEWWESTGTNSVILRAQAWSAWLARAEVDQPQPAEDPDEWVILDSVKYANHVPRVGVDEFSTGNGRWQTQKEHHCNGTVAYWKAHEDLIHRCRRRDLLKVESCDIEDGLREAPKIDQAEKWPKYYKPSQPRKTGYGKHVAYYKCSEAQKGETIHTDGTSFGFTVRAPGVDWTEITEAEAMLLLDKPKQCSVGCHGPRCKNAALPGKDHCSECADEPQPQKTRVRLFASFGALHIRMPGEITEGIGREVKHDSEGFYVESQS